MGQTQSTSSNGMFLVGKPGDTFTLTIPNAVDAWSQMNGQPAGDRFAAFMVSSSGPFSHLIYKGVLKEEIQSGLFTYTLTSVTATDKLGVTMGKPTWTASPTATDGWMAQYIQSRDTDSNGYRQPPIITGGPKGNLIPTLINTQSTPGFKLDGDFGDLKPSQIYKFMNDYATQSLSIVTPSHPFYSEIQRASKTYTSNDQINTAFNRIKQSVSSQLGNPAITLVTENASGTVKTQVNVRDYLSKPFTAIAYGSNKETKYVGIEMTSSFENDYAATTNGLDSYSASVKSSHGYEAVLKNVDFKGDVALDKPITGIPLISSIHDKAYTKLLSKIKQLQDVGIHVEGWTQRTQHGSSKVYTTLYRTLYPVNTSNTSEGSVSGTIRGAKAMEDLGTKRSHIKGVNTVAYSKLLNESGSFNAASIRALRQQYVSLLAMMLAFQRLNPGQNSLIQSIGVAMGTTDRTINGVNVSQMWKYSQVLDAFIKNVDSAVSDRVKRDSAHGVEGFMSSGSAFKPFEKESLYDSVTNRPRARLLNVLEQNDAVLDKLAGAYTEASAQFAGMVAAAGVFVAIAMLPE